MQILPHKFEDKKLIVEFMDCEVYETYRSPTAIDYSVKGQMVIDFREKGFLVGGFEDRMMFTNLAFDSSFDWIVPVVEKIEAMGYVVEIWWNQCRIIDNEVHGATRERLFPRAGKTKLEAVFLTVIAFIKYYNSRQEQSQNNNQNFLLAKKIKDTLKEQKISQVKFSEMMGVKSPMVSKWLNGTNNFRVNTLIKIEEVLKIQLVNLK